LLIFNISNFSNNIWYKYVLVLVVGISIGINTVTVTIVLYYCCTGSYSSNGADNCTQCPQGYKCPTNTGLPVLCGVGLYRWVQYYSFVI